MKVQRNHLPYLIITLFFLITAPAVSAANDNQETGATSESDDKFSSETLHAQVILDRLLFSPGAIDGIHGQNAASAIMAFQQVHDLEPTGEIDTETSRALLAAKPKSGNSREDSHSRSEWHSDSHYLSALTTYTITETDVKTTFAESPADSMAEKARRDALRYGDLREMLAERFHCTPALLERLNPQTELETDAVITVPNIRFTCIHIPADKVKGAGQKSDDHENEVDDSEANDCGLRTASDDHATTPPAELVRGPVTIIVSKEDTTLSVLDKSGKLVFHAPVTAGSKHDPLPLGEWKVNGTEKYPVFHYNPDLFWDSEASDEKAEIPAGPNNPVGIAWIDISKPHYGLHGTPVPETIGYTESHGCVRLTNWDIKRLSKMAEPGTKVYFVETPEDRLERARKIREEITRRHENKSEDEKHDGES